jgi:hypothetical protein
VRADFDIARRMNRDAILAEPLEIEGLRQRRCTWKAAVGCSDIVDWNDAESPSVLVRNMDGAIASGEFRSCLAKRARQPDGLYLRCYLVNQIVHAVI